MIIDKKVYDKELTLDLKGRLDTVAAPELESVLKESLEGVESLVFDCKDLEYISSAGLRVLLSAQKIMNVQGSMKLTHVDETILSVFEVTGFIDILTIE